MPTRPKDAPVPSTPSPRLEAVPRGIGDVRVQGRCLLMAGVLMATGRYGWSTVVRHTFFERIVDRAGLELGLNPSDYCSDLRGYGAHFGKGTGVARAVRP